LSAPRSPRCDLFFNATNRVGAMLARSGAIGGVGAVMSSLGWAILLVGAALASDVGWSEYREWRARREAVRRGRTITAKFTLRRVQ